MSLAVSSEMLVHVQVEFGAQVEVEESIDEQQQKQDGRQHQENILTEYTKKGHHVRNANVVNECLSL